MLSILQTLSPSLSRLSLLGSPGAYQHSSADGKQKKIIQVFNNNNWLFSIILLSIDNYVVQPRLIPNSAPYIPKKNQYRYIHKIQKSNKSFFFTRIRQLIEKRSSTFFCNSSYLACIFIEYHNCLYSCLFFCQKTVIRWFELTKCHCFNRAGWSRSKFF